MKQILWNIFRNNLAVISALLVLLSSSTAQKHIKADTSAFYGRTNLQQVVNYLRMGRKDTLFFFAQQKRIIEQREKLKIPVQFTIPFPAVSYRQPDWRRYYMYYCPVKHLGVGYVPSDLVNYYEEEAWNAYKIYGKDAPSLSVVLAQQFTESAFNPKAIGDKGRSKGLPQLFINTAKWLLKEDRSFWSSMIYIDKKGKHHFKDTRSMVKFPFHFLPKYKQYTSQQRFEGLRRYNGKGDAAEQYAQKVMARAIFYEEWFSRYYNYKIDTNAFINNLFDVVNMHFFLREEQQFTTEALYEMFDNVIKGYNNGNNIFRGWSRQGYIAYENLPVVQQTSTDFVVPTDGNDYYLIIEHGHTLYSYFASIDDMFKCLNHEANKKFKVYTYVKKKKVFIKSAKELKNTDVYSNVKPGDALLLPPGVKVTSFGNDIAIGIIPVD